MIDRLDHKIIEVTDLNTPNIVHFKVGNILEKYVRLNSLPDSLTDLVLSLAEASRIESLIKVKLPFLPVPKISYNHSGVVSLYWTLDDTSTFSVMLLNYRRFLDSKPPHDLQTKGSIKWNYYNPRLSPASGDLKDEEELISFMERSLIHRD